MNDFRARQSSFSFDYINNREEERQSINNFFRKNGLQEVCFKTRTIRKL